VTGQLAFAAASSIAAAVSDLRYGLSCLSLHGKMLPIKKLIDEFSKIYRN